MRTVFGRFCMAKLASLAIDPAEVAALRSVALMHLGDQRQQPDEPVKLSCEALGTSIGASAQTASRRLRDLEAAGLVTRESLGDGQRITVTDDGVSVLRDEYELYRQLFEAPSIVEFVGNATSGMGEGRHYIALAGYMAQFTERLGYEPFPGTLNVELSAPSVRRRTRLDGVPSVPIDGWEDDERTYGPATCYPAVVEGPDGRSVESAHIIEPVRTHHDADHMEIISPVHLRDKLGIDDGNRLLIRSGELR